MGGPFHETCMPILTKSELKIVKQAARRIKTERHYCHVNSQRMAYHCESGDILYHEGTFNGNMAHAWNSINGKLIDISGSFEQIVEPECYHLFVAHGTYTRDDIFEKLTKVKFEWSWFGDPQTMGNLHEETTHRNQG